ncbi:unnamed protein product [Symbiodinium pilosum]|uniref:Uncharacterized protein n=1 Tax=Symbiodinium pilosum TaxID=2952 RepID=A0A812Q974_SYMPI|nr:unnamed protein product [Symbiodinium pilosum]
MVTRSIWSHVSTRWWPFWSRACIKFKSLLPAAPHAFQSSDGSATLRPIRRRKVWQLGVLQNFADFGGSSKTLDRIPDAAIHNPAQTLLCP